MIYAVPCITHRSNTIEYNAVKRYAIECYAITLFLCYQSEMKETATMGHVANRLLNRWLWLWLWWMEVGVVIVVVVNVMVVIVVW